MAVEWYLVKEAVNRESEVAATLENQHLQHLGLRRTVVPINVDGINLYPGFLLVQLEDSESLRTAILTEPGVLEIVGDLSLDEVASLLSLMVERRLSEVEGFRIGDIVRLRKGTPTKWCGKVTAVTTLGLEVDFEIFGRVFPFGEVALELVERVDQLDEPSQS